MAKLKQAEQWRHVALVLGLMSALLPWTIALAVPAAWRARILRKRGL